MSRYLCASYASSGVYLDLIYNIEGIRISTKREYYLHQGVCNAVSAVGRPFEGVLEVCCGVFDRGTTTKDDKACDTNALTLELGV